MKSKTQFKLGIYTIKFGNYWDKPFWGHITKFISDDGTFTRECHATARSKYYYFKFVSFGKLEEIDR